MKNKYSYISISFIILVFGIWATPKIIEKFSQPPLEIIGQVPAFSCTNHLGKKVTNKTFEDKIYIVEFFFTTCPSICPIMNRNMVKIQNEFYGNPKLGIASFSIDPETDTIEVLKKYAENYKIVHPNWHLLRGSKVEIYELANKGFNLFVGENTKVDGGFEHSGFFALIDQDGNIRSRKDENNNPIVYYNGLEDSGIKMLIEDIKKLL